MKLQTEVCNFIKKKTLAQVFSCELYEISKKYFYYRTPLVAASRSVSLFLMELSHYIFTLN